MRNNILVVAKDTAVRAQLARQLSGAGHRIELAQTVQTARRLGSDKAFSLAILVAEDLGPEGLGTADELSAITGRPPLVISSPLGGSTQNNVSGRLGFDNLLSQVAEALEMHSDLISPQQPLRFGGYALDLDGCTLADA